MLLGLVGKPSAGKSTFFRASTLAEASIASYPFTTIKPNHGIAYVKIECIDKEFKVQCNPNHGFCLQGKRFIPVEILDVAGLVPGASEGKGLGNKFLDDLRQADAFIHIVDVSGATNSEGKILTDSTHDPSKDIEFLELELNKWFFSLLVKAWKNFIKKIETESEKNFSRAIARQFSGLKVREEQIKNVLRKNNFPEKINSWSNETLMKFAFELRKESKPIIVAANKIDMEKSESNYKKLKSKFPEMVFIPCSADSELALREASKSGLIDYISGEKNFENKKQLNEKQKEALKKIRTNILEKYGSTGVQDVLNHAVFSLLNYIAVFPVDNANKLSDSKGNILPDCFLLPNSSTALDFAYHLHTDFGKNFIRAINAKTKKTLGKDYILKHRDVIEIITR